MRDELISIIVPCYNEAQALLCFYEETVRVLKDMQIDYELLLINDGSSDDTLQIMKDLAGTDEKVKYFSFSRNFGKEAAMYAGFCNAMGDYITVMDADLQDPPSLLPKMYEMLLAGDCDSVAARRVSRRGEAPVRSFFARMFYRLINHLTDVQIRDGARDYRLMKRNMVDAIVSMSEYNRFSKGIFGWVGFRTSWLEYENEERVAGKTKWSFWGLIKYALDGIISFSDSPIAIASWMGFIMTILSVFMLLFVVIRRLIFGDPVAGWASTICVIIFIGGLQLFCLGIMGQYISKIYMETKNRPHFIIAESNRKDATRIR